MQIDKKKLSLRDLPSMRQMLAFMAVYKYEHMSAAAEELSLTQPAVTVLIKELENKLNIQLFDRATRHLKPTFAAELILPYIKRALADLQSMQHAVSQLNYLKTGYLRLAVTPNSTQNLLSHILEGFVIKFPDIEIDIVESDPLTLMNTLLNDKADICLGLLEKNIPFIQSSPVFQDEIVAIHHKTFKCLTLIETWEDLKNEQLILTQQGYGIRNIIDQHLKTLFDIPSISAYKEVSLISTVVAMVKSGLGVGLVPYSSIQFNHENLIIHKLPEPKVYREISVFHLKEKSLSPTTKAFIEHCKHLRN